MDKNVLDDIQSFIGTIDSMLKTKFVLVDKAIGKVLTEIAKNKTIYNIIAECTISFNFNNEYKSCFENGKFKAPLEDGKCIGVVFLLLTNFDEKKMDITNFINENFDNLDSYKEFLDRVIIPFKIAVLHYYDTNVETNEDFKFDKKSLTPEIESRILFLLKSLQDKVTIDKRLKKCIKSHTIIILNTMIRNLNNKKIDSLYALYIGLKYTLKVRRYKKLFNEIDDFVVYLIGENK